MQPHDGRGADALDRAAYLAASADDVAREWRGPGIRPAHVMDVLQRLLPANALLTSDAGNFGLWLARGFMWKKSGIPVEHAVPSEGATSICFEMAVPKNARNREGGLGYLNAALDAKAQSRPKIEVELRDAIQNDVLRPYYQPLIDLQSGRITGFEALVRWSHPERGMVGPDQFIPLEERTAIANREAADLFLSIHVNASRNKQAAGVETYVLNFATNPEAEAVAARENSASGRTMHNLPSIVQAIALNNKIDESRDFAEMVQKSMVRRLTTRNKLVRDLGVKQAPFVVLIGAGMPSVLAEISFVTNKQEGALLKTPAYRQQIAESLFDAIVRYQRSLKGVREATVGELAQAPGISEALFATAIGLVAAIPAAAAAFVMLFSFLARRAST